MSSPSANPRMVRELKTVEAMITLYCRGRHNPVRNELCPECAELLDYARHKLGLCPFQEAKSTCAKCKIHCYSPDRRAQIKTVMAYAGPRMVGRHPLLALNHLLDGRREPPEP